MDNLTHTFCGWALSRAGLDRFGAWVPPTMMIAANLPDIESLVFPPLPLSKVTPGYLLHHRGLSHSAIGAVVGTVVLAALVWAVGRYFRDRLHDPPRFSHALLVCFPAVLSHLLLDWFNTYGLRPWLPFSDKPYYGDLAFIVDPWMWMILGSAIFLGSKRSRFSRNVWLFISATTATIILTHAWRKDIPWQVPVIWAVMLSLVAVLRHAVFQSQPSRTPARAGLLVFMVYVGLLLLASRTAVNRAYEVVQRGETGLKTGKIGFSANPTPAIPWRFEVVAYSETTAQQITVDLIDGRVAPHKQTNPRLDDPALEKIKDTEEFRAWKYFARHPVVERRKTAIVLGDLRYRLTTHPDWSELPVALPPSEIKELPREEAGDK